MYVEIFRTCARVIQTGFAKAEGYRLNPTERDRIHRAKRTILDFICILCREKHTDGERGLITGLQRALTDVHPRTDYAIRATMIRDLADFVITLERLEQARRRADEKKYVEAKQLCQFLAEDLSA